MIVKRIYEQHTGHAKSMKLKTLIEISKSICQIKFKDSIGTGFFMKMKYKGILKNFLITTYHVLLYALTQGEKSFEIICDAGNVKQEIILAPIRLFLVYNILDSILIEIIDNDLIKDKVKFLEIDSNFDNYGVEDFYNKDIFIIHYPKGEELECASGKIVMPHIPEHYNFQHNLDTCEGSIGSPILLLQKGNEAVKVIGMHISENIENNNKIGIFINKFNDLFQKLKYENIKFLRVPDGYTLEIPNNVDVITKKLKMPQHSKLVVGGVLHINGNQNESKNYCESNKNEKYFTNQENDIKNSKKTTINFNNINIKDIGEFYMKGDEIYIKNKECLKNIQIFDN